MVNRNSQLANLGLRLVLFCTPTTTHAVPNRFGNWIRQYLSPFGYTPIRQKDPSESFRIFLASSWLLQFAELLLLNWKFSPSLYWRYPIFIAVLWLLLTSPALSGQRPPTLSPLSSRQYYCIYYPELRTTFGRLCLLPHDPSGKPWYAVSVR